jgi:peptide-methionine (S)-S-oxide reductase
MKTEIAVIAAGCFWGVEELLRAMNGVIDTEVGYCGGEGENPVYTKVKTGKTGHAEAVKVIFDPQKLSYADLIRAFYKLHDPTTLNQQGNDIGTQYRSAIFYTSPEQKTTAEQVTVEVSASGFWKKPIVTQIVPLQTFYSAEDYHQDYLQKNPDGYTCHYWR